MLGNIQVVTKDLRDAAREIHLSRAAIEGILSRTTRIIEDAVSDGWQDRAGVMYLDRFRELRARYFHRYPEAMEEYVVFLTSAADRYDAGEDARRRDVESLGNMGR